LNNQPSSSRRVGQAADHPVATYTLYNIDRVKLEHLLHDFFAEARLNIEITDRFGKKINVELRLDTGTKKGNQVNITCW
jgi:hypothetical protein